jgi:hypothetical protein
LVNIGLKALATESREWRLNPGFPVTRSIGGRPANEEFELIVRVLFGFERPSVVHREMPGSSRAGL